MPDHYAVIGHPIAHSQSPRIHGLFAQATEQQLTYEAIDGGDQPGGFAHALADFRAAGGRGMNVTLPFKWEALARADEADDAARQAGTANALRFEDGRIQARNFDGAGLVRDIAANLGVPIRGARVLILGAGGAARGVILPLARADLGGGARRIVIANRTADKAQLVAAFAPHVNTGGCAIEGTGLGDVDGEPFDIVINATSASLAGVAPEIPDRVLARARLAYDMVYGKGLTPFLRQAQSAGAQQLADGIGMLVEQAADTFAWWRGVRPDTGPVIALLARPLV